MTPLKFLGIYFFLFIAIRVSASRARLPSVPGACSFSLANSAVDLPARLAAARKEPGCLIAFWMKFLAISASRLFADCYDVAQTVDSYARTYSNRCRIYG